MKKNFFPTILISVLLAFWGLVLFGYNYSEAIVISKTNTTASSLRNGLVAWWTMDGVDTTSVTTSDKSGGGFHATRQGGVRMATGKLGQAVFFNGSDSDFLSYTTPTVNTTTISFWYKTNTLTLPNNHRMLLSSFVDSTYISLNENGVAAPFISLNIGGIQRTLPSGVPSKVGKWTHLVTTWDGSINRVYIDGIFANSSPDYSGGALAGFNGGAGHIGRWQAAAGWSTHGSIDDMRIYNRALSPVEITQLYTMGGDKINKTDLVRSQLRNGLVGHWTMDGIDMTSRTSTDRSGRGNNGTRNTTTIAVGKIGQAVKFLPTVGAAYSSSSIIIPSNTDFTTGAAGTFSFSFWIKPNVFGGTFISRKHYCSNNGHFAIRMDVGGVVYLGFYSDLDTLGTIYASENIISTGKWQHVTVTKRWGTANATKLYLDGVARNFTVVDGVDTSQGTTYTDLLTIIGAEAAAGECGADSASGPKNNFFNGAMDDVRVYNRILTPVEVVELYKMGGGVVGKSNTVVPALKNGLLAHWTFDGKTVTTNTTTDSSGNGNDGYLLTSLRPLQAVGKIGQGMKFDGTSRIVRIATSSSLGPLGNTASVSFWVKSDNLSAGAAEVMFGYGNASQYPGGFLFYKNNRTLNVYWKAAGPITSLPDFFSTSTWVHIAMTNDNGTMNIYRNSVWYAGPGTTGGAITDPTFNYFIGGEDNGGWFTRGILDDIRVYNRVISGAEIKELYSMGK